MDSPEEVPLPKVHKTFLTLSGREGLYYLTDGGCLFLPTAFTLNFEEEDDSDCRQYLYQAPNDTILYTPDFVLMYRVRHYPVLMKPELGFGILDFPVNIEPDNKVCKTHLVLSPSFFNWGKGRGQLCDLDAELQNHPSLSQRLIVREGKSSGRF